MTTDVTVIHTANYKSQKLKPDKFFMGTHLRTTGCRLPYGITRCYLPPDTSEHTPP